MNKKLEEANVWLTNDNQLMQLNCDCFFPLDIMTLHSTTFVEHYFILTRLATVLVQAVFYNYKQGQYMQWSCLHVLNRVSAAEDSA